MNNRHRLGVFLPLVLTAFVAVPAVAATDGVAAVDAAWMKAVKAGSVDAVMACYAADATAWLPDAPAAKGEKAIRASYEALFAANAVTDVTFSDTEYRVMRGAAAGWGKFSLTLVPKATGKPVVLSGRFSEFAERREGRWVYVLDHASTEPPPAASPAPGAKK